MLEISYNEIINDFDLVIQSGWKIIPVMILADRLTSTIIDPDWPNNYFGRVPMVCNFRP